jgi:hypothetical protein
MPAMSTIRALVIASLVLTPLACSYDDAVRRFTPPDADARSRAYLSLLTRRQPDSAMSRLVGDLQSPETRQQLINVMGILEDERFDSIRVIGANIVQTTGAKRVDLTYEMRSSNRWFQANVATIDSAGDWKVYDLHVNALPQSLESTEWFALRGKTVLQYLWLLATGLSPVVCAATAIFIATRKSMPRRWRWVFMALIGYGIFQMNWSTGDWSINTLSVQLLGAGYVRASPYSPYIFKFSIPLGAAMALVRYRSWRAKSAIPVISIPAG